jgi:hypothetical protein
VFEMFAKTRMLAHQHQPPKRLTRLHSLPSTLCCTLPRTLGRTLCRTAPVRCSPGALLEALEGTRGAW